MTKDGWICCPMCKRKTRIKIYPDTVAQRFPLYCRFCKAEMFVDIKDGDIKPSEFIKSQT